jgi:hypothetical protein
MPTEQLCEEAVNRVIRSSLYPPEQKERLRASVMKVICGALTINSAANMYGLPSSTVHPYVHRVRAALGDDCPPQALGPTPHVYSFSGAQSEWTYRLVRQICTRFSCRQASCHATGRAVHVGQGHTTCRAHKRSDDTRQLGWEQCRYGCQLEERADRSGAGRCNRVRASQVQFVWRGRSEEVVRGCSYGSSMGFMQTLGHIQK